jgi:hypothetical protein
MMNGKQNASLGVEIGELINGMIIAFYELAAFMFVVHMKL